MGNGSIMGVGVMRMRRTQDERVTTYHVASNNTQLGTETDAVVLTVAVALAVAAQVDEHIALGRLLCRAFVVVEGARTGMRGDGRGSAFAPSQNPPRLPQAGIVYGTRLQ